MLLFFISRNLLCSLGHNIAVIFGLMLLATTWIFWISYRSKYRRLMVLHLFPFLNPPWFICEMLPAWIFPKNIMLANAHLNWVNWSHFLILVGDSLAILIGCMIFVSIFLDIIRMFMKSTVNRCILSLGSL